MNRLDRLRLGLFRSASPDSVHLNSLVEADGADAVPHRSPRQAVVRQVGTTSLIEASINCREPLITRNPEDIEAERAQRIGELKLLVLRLDELDMALGRSPSDIFMPEADELPPVSAMTSDEVKLAIPVHEGFIKRHQIRLADLHLADQQKVPGE